MDAGPRYVTPTYLEKRVPPTPSSSFLTGLQQVEGLYSFLRLLLWEFWVPPSKCAWLYLILLLKITERTAHARPPLHLLLLQHKWGQEVVLEIGGAHAAVRHLWCKCLKWEYPFNCSLILQSYSSISPLLFTSLHLVGYVEVDDRL